MKAIVEKIVTKITAIAVAVRNDKRAVTALEYGLIASLIAVVIVSATTTLGSKVSSTFTKISSSFNLT